MARSPAGKILSPGISVFDHSAIRGLFEVPESGRRSPNVEDAFYSD
jgi:hypothetical protein